jgi:hypothetical protein
MDMTVVSEGYSRGALDPARRIQYTGRPLRVSPESELARSPVDAR